MSKGVRLPSAAAVARARAVADRRLTADEVRAGLAARASTSELEEAADLIRWFTTRYPTAADRLRYARRTHRRWLAAVGQAGLRR